MSLRYALLGLLAKRASTGYELHQQFKEKLVYFWNVHHSQIYRDLGKMESEQLVSSEVVHQTAHPDKKIYTLTSKGTVELIGWVLRQPSSSAIIKDEFLVRVNAFPIIAEDEAIRLLSEMKQREQRVLEKELQWRNEHFRTDELPDMSRISEYLTSEFGVIYTRGYIQWCEWALSVFHAIKRQKAAPDSHE
ncbi:PadR family transcriptional regulator [Paenibacillus piri]|uniref:PadR family transcriptional regulator n=1 Tax=Paenibacillus piri TaxID=2547395 RepID=A0A4R5KCW5_9BACL|nr:PadR family transcriptional regulator [Paenibacillus piri]TDF92338.1 PadR family transcriptional regulator [Paenibacillus piri]